MITTQGDLFPQPLPKADIADVLWQKLSRSAFRSRFHLNAQDMAYLRDKGLPAVLEHGRGFINRRLAPAAPARDGRQTPWKGHPVFVAQHATGTCCRSCLEKWHSMSKGTALTETQQQYVLAVLAVWLERELHASTTTPPVQTDGVG